jgi:hypothetical protein
VQHLQQVGSVDPQGLGRTVEVEPVAGLVLHLGDQDGLAPQAGGPGDPVALRLHPDDLRVGVLRDLADQRPAVALRHPIARFDALVGRDQPIELLLIGGDVHTPSSLLTVR